MPARDKTAYLKLKAVKTNKSDFNSCKNIENIPVGDLDLLLSRCFIAVRKQNVREHEPLTLSQFKSFQVWPEIINILFTKLSRVVFIFV